MVEVGCHLQCRHHCIKWGGGFLGRSPTPAKYLSTAGVFGKLQALGVCQRDTLFDAQNTYIDTRDRDETVLRIIS